MDGRTSPRGRVINTAAVARTGQDANKNIDESTEEKISNADPGEDDFFGRWADCIKVEKGLLPAKLFYFAFFSARGAITPYMSIYLKQLGLRPAHIGLITGLRPLLGFPSGPLWGAIADKFKIRRTLFYISLIGWLVFKMALGFIPSTKPIKTCPNEGNLSLSERMLSPLDVINYSKTLSTSMSPTSASPYGYTRYHLLRNNHLNIPKELADTYNHYFHVITDKDNTAWAYDPDDIKRVFITLALLVIAGEFLQAPTSALADAGTIDKLGPGNGHKYALQRAWGSAGFGISALIVGFLLSLTRKVATMCGHKLILSDYMISFFVFGGFMCLAIVAGLNFKFKGYELRVENKHSLKAVFRILATVHYGSWLATAFYMGLCNGVIWGFLYWHLENLGATQTHLGAVIVVTYLSEFVMFFLCDRLILKPLGCIGTLYLALVCYSIRFATYSIVKEPWLVLPVEILQGITFSAVWSSMTRYSILTFPRDSLATMQGILHGIYWGLGLGIGHLVGGVMMSRMGAEKSFGVMAMTSLIVLLVFALVQKLSNKPPDPLFNEGTGTT